MQLKIDSVGRPKDFESEIGQILPGLAYDIASQSYYALLYATPSIILISRCTESGPRAASASWYPGLS